MPIVTKEPALLEASKNIIAISNVKYAMESKFS